MGLFSTAFVEYGYYKSTEELVQAVNFALKVGGVDENNIKLSFNPVAGNVLVRSGRGYQLGIAGKW